MVFVLVHSYGCIIFHKIKRMKPSASNFLIVMAIATCMFVLLFPSSSNTS